MALSIRVNDETRDAFNQALDTLAKRKGLKNRDETIREVTAIVTGGATGEDAATVDRWDTYSQAVADATAAVSAQVAAMAAAAREVERVASQEYRSKLDGLVGELAEMHKEVAEAKQARADAETALQEANQQVAALSKENKKLERDLAKVQKEYEDAKDNLLAAAQMFASTRSTEDAEQNAEPVNEGGEDA